MNKEEAKLQKYSEYAQILHPLITGLVLAVMVGIYQDVKTIPVMVERQSNTDEKLDSMQRYNESQFKQIYNRFERNEKYIFHNYNQKGE